MDIKHALVKLAEQVLLAGDNNLPILLNGAANEISEIQQLNAELAAQLELIHKAWLCPYPECVMEELNEVINKTPTQCLAEHDREVAAKAVNKFSEHLIWDRMFAKSEVRAASEEYVSKIKSGEVEI